MSALVKKCCHCRSDLPEINGIGTPQVQCEKCKKNEEKYGKPGICNYCQLPAAFRDGKCVYCSHSERKFGAPVSCANCKLKAAFQRDSKNKKPVLCRVCIALARSNKQTTMAGVAVPPHDKISSSQKDKEKSHKRKREPSTSESSGPKLKSIMDSGEHVLQVQQLKDKISDLQQQIQKRDLQMQEKDKKIAALTADARSAERKYKEKFQQLLKEKEEAVNTVHQKYRSEKNKK